MPAKALKAAEKQNILKKLVVELKRRYGGSLPKETRPTFETLLFATCLEDTTYPEAEAAYARMMDAFFDLNEIRVSSVSEIEASLGELHDSDWKAMRIREALQHTFEKHYAFDLEGIRRKTQDAALKDLAEIPYQTSFARLYTVQHGLGAHVLPIDRSMQDVLVWLGLAEADAEVDAVGEDLRSAVKKAEGVLICHLVKSAATDPELRPAFAEGPGEEHPDPNDAAKRLVELFKNPKKGRKAPVKAAKAVSLKRPVKKETSRSGAATKPAAKKVVTKVTKKRPEPKKTARKRTK